MPTPPSHQRYNETSPSVSSPQSVLSSSDNSYYRIIRDEQYQGNSHQYLPDASEASISGVSTEQRSATAGSSIPKVLAIAEYNRALLEQSTKDPRVLIGCRVIVEGYGLGVILDTQKVKFSTTRYVVQFVNGVRILSLKRSASKGKIPFTVLSKLN
jgi:hypothetical protein